jgi:hypothetical protein
MIQYISLLLDCDGRQVTYTLDVDGVVSIEHGSDGDIIINYRNGLTKRYRAFRYAIIRMGVRV